MCDTVVYNLLFLIQCALTLFSACCLLVV